MVKMVMKIYNKLADIEKVENFNYSDEIELIFVEMFTYFNAE